MKSIYPIYDQKALKTKLAKKIIENINKLNLKQIVIQEFNKTYYYNNKSAILKLKSKILDGIDEVY